MGTSGKSPSQVRNTSGSSPTLVQECSWSGIKKRYIDTNFQQLKAYVPSMKIDPKRNYVLDSCKFLYSNSVPRATSIWNNMTQFQRVILTLFTLVFIWVPVLVFAIFFFNATLFAIVFYALFLNLSTLYNHIDATFVFYTGHQLSQFPSFLFGYLSYAMSMISSYTATIRESLAYYLCAIYGFISEAILLIWSYVPSTLKHDLVDLYADRVYPLGQKANQQVSKLTHQVLKYTHPRAPLQK